VPKAGIGSRAEMIDTPWGPSESLRDRRLRPGPGMAPEDVARNQRARLFGAMVASVSERGYAATRQSDLLELSGVSGNTFYALFADKEACFVAAMEAVVFKAVRALTVPTGSWEEMVRGTTTGFAQLFVAQPAAARMCLLAAHEVGADGLRPFQEATERFEAFARAEQEKSPAAEGMPAEMLAAWVGGLIEIGRARLRHGTEASLLDLIEGFIDLVLSYRPPPQPLRLSVRPPTPAAETIEGHDHAERGIRALALVAAQHGYANITVNQIINRASMSATTFYANFEDKEDALMAAIESACAQLMAAMLPAFRRSQDWAQGVRAAWGAFFNFLASRPSLAHLVLVEVYAAGPAAIGRREEALRPLEILLAEGRLRSPEVPWIAREAIPGGVLALAYHQIRRAGPESLPTLAPICTYLTLAPYIGADEAASAANGDGRTRSSRSLDLPRRVLLVEVWAQLALHDWNLEDLTTEMGRGRDEVGAAVENLHRAGLIAARDEGDEVIYRALTRTVQDEEWAAMTDGERHNMSRSIVHVITAELDLALDSGTFDARLDRFLSRVPMLLDKHGWAELMEAHRRAFHESLRIQREATKRLRTAGPAIEGTSVQTLFELPRTEFDLALGHSSPERPERQE
jgi:AcrR family transcriptional regulator